MLIPKPRVHIFRNFYSHRKPDYVCIAKDNKLTFFFGVNMWVNWHKQAEVCANRVRACYMALQGAEARRSTQSLTSTATCSGNPPPPLRPPKKLQDLSKMNENETWRLQERKKTSSSLSYLAFKPRIKVDNAL